MWESTGDRGTALYGYIETMSYHSMVNIDIDIIKLNANHNNNHLYIQVNSGASLGTIWTANLSQAGIMLKITFGLTQTLSI